MGHENCARIIAVWKEKNLNFKSKFLIAMPQLAGSCFEKSVIWIFQDDDKGTRGLVINKPHSLQLNEIFVKFGLREIFEEKPLLWGGPVQQEQGVIIHTDEKGWASTEAIVPGVAFTVTTDVLESISLMEGPKKYLIGLGYSGWGPGQLEEEIANDAWLVTNMNAHLLFDVSCEEKYESALRTLKIDPQFFEASNGIVGHA